MVKEQLTAREAARLDLVRRAVGDRDTLERAFAHAVKLSAETLQVARVGVWLFEDNMQSIRCVVSHELGRGTAAPGERIDLRACPQYAESLATRRALCADDARSDPRTVELLPYFERHGITSLLDSPIFRQGEAVAILCHEHVGQARSWSTADKHFAATVSDMLGVYLEQHATEAYYEELLKTRNVLEEHRRMESLGRMATAVSHDINNLLLAIGLKAELLARGTPTERAPAAEELQAIVEQGARLVRQLLDVGRRDSGRAEVTDLTVVLRDMDSLLRTYERGGISLSVHLPAEPAKIMIERSRLEQVVMNLVINGRDALLGGGALNVDVLLVSASDRDAAARDVVLVVSDTGIGMTEDVREKIFEPFFTTRADSQGHGLGLATVYGIVTNSKGKIAVESQLGAGTRFTVKWREAT